MGLFDFLDRSKNPEEKFEDLLMQAAKNPGKRPAFYRDFLNIQLYFEGKTVGGYVGDKEVVRENQPIEFHYTAIEGKVRLYVFSSIKRLQETISEGANYIRMNARQLLGMLRQDAGVYLNPGSDCGKEFTPEEIKSLLDGTIFRELKRIDLKGMRPLMLGQPAKPPLKLVEALKSYFAENGYVENAYMGQYYDGKSDEGPQCVIGIRMSHSAGVTFSGILPSLGMIARDTIEKDKSVDFMDINDGGAIADYLVKDTKPFFSGT